MPPKKAMSFLNCLRLSADIPAAEEPEAEPEVEEEESPLYPDAAEDEQDYVKAFENAVYQTPDTADEDAPKISFCSSGVA